MLKSFITCGTFQEEAMPGSIFNQLLHRQPFWEDDSELVGENAMIEKAVLNNEYLRMILRDPTLQRHDVNFLKQ